MKYRPVIEIVACLLIGAACGCAYRELTEAEPIAPQGYGHRASEIKR